MKPDKHRPYTRSDIEKYYSGYLSAKEMHDMEAYALEDPFFADALDGYAAAQKNTSDTHLATIKHFVQSDNAKIISAPSRKNNWLKYIAAASLILFITIGALYFFNSGQHEERIAVAPASAPNLQPYIDTSAVLDKLAAAEKPDSFKEEKKDAIAAKLSANHKKYQPVLLDADKPAYVKPGEPVLATEVAAPTNLSGQAFFSTKINNDKDTLDVADRIVVSGNNIAKQTDMATAMPQRKEDISNALAGRAAGIRIQKCNETNKKTAIRGGAAGTQENEPLIIINGVTATTAEMSVLDKEDIASVNVLNSKEAVAIYGSTGTNGAIIITTHPQKKIKKDSAYNSGASQDSSLRTK